LLRKKKAQIIVREASLGKLTTASEGELFAREQELLDQMTEASRIQPRLPDARVKKLVEWIKIPDVSGYWRSGEQSGT